MTYIVSSGTLNSSIPYDTIPVHIWQDVAKVDQIELSLSLSVLSLIPVFFRVCFALFTGATLIMLRYFAFLSCSVSRLFWLGCPYQCKWLTGKTRLRNDLQCVDENVKPCSLTPYGDLVWPMMTCQNMPVNQNPIRRVISDIHTHTHVTKSVIYSLQWFDTVGWVTGHPACKITCCSFVGGDDLTGDLHVL